MENQLKELLNLNEWNRFKTFSTNDESEVFLRDKLKQLNTTHNDYLKLSNILFVYYQNRYCTVNHSIFKVGIRRVDGNKIKKKRKKNGFDPEVSSFVIFR
jgi:hypothetical protein